jgi:lysozyme
VRGLLHPGVGRAASGGCESWTFWQYSARGRVDGVDGPVDLDAYCGDEASFERLGQSPGEEQP